MSQNAYHQITVGCYLRSLNEEKVAFFQVPKDLPQLPWVLRAAGMHEGAGVV